MRVLRVILLVWVIVMGMCFSASASLQKTGEGLIFGETWKTFGNDFVTNSGTWSVTGTYYMTTPSSGDLEYIDQSGIPLPADYVYIQRFLASKQYYMYVRYVDSSHYYRISIYTSGANYGVEIKEDTGPGLGTNLCSTSNLVAHGNSYHNIKLVLQGTSLIVYSDSGVTLCSATGQSQGSGRFKFIGIDATGSLDYSIWTLNNSVTINNVPANNWAIICNSNGTKLTSVQNGGSISNVVVSLSNISTPINGSVEIATSDGNCNTSTVDAYRTLSIYGGETFTYYSSEQLTHGPWLGAPYWESGAYKLKVGYRLKDSQVPKIQWKLATDTWPDSTCTNQCIVGSSVTASDDYTGVIILPNLASSTTYDYRLYVGNNPQTGGGGRFTTFVAPNNDASIDIAVFSCQSAERRKYLLYDQLISKKPHLAIITGDFIYEGTMEPGEGQPSWEGECRTLNGSSLPECYWLRYRDVRADPLASSYFKNNFSIAMWDDHESCNDISGGRGSYHCSNDVAQTYSNTVFDGAKSAFIDYVAGTNPPSEPSLEQPPVGDLQFVYRIGNVDIFITDLMTYRDHTQSTDAITTYLTGTITISQGDTTLTCSGCNWSTLSASTSNPDRILVKYAGYEKYYTIENYPTSTTATLKSGESINCGSCSVSSSNYEIIGSIKTQLQTRQFNWFLNNLKASTATTKLWVSTKLIDNASNPDTWGATPSGYWSASGYTYERDKIRTFRRDYVSGVWGIVSGDNHKTLLAKRTDIDSSGEYELSISGTGTPNYVSSTSWYKLTSTQVLEAATMQNTYGLLGINTTANPDTIVYKAYNEMGDVVIGGNRLYQSTISSIETNLGSSVAHKIACNSSGICVAIYWTGYNQKVCVSDANGKFTIYSNCVSVASSLDAGGNTGSLTINGNVVYIAVSDTSTTYAKVGTISAGILSITDTQTVVEGAFVKSDIIQGSDGYIYISLIGTGGGGYLYRSTNPNSIVGWGLKYTFVNADTYSTIGLVAINNGSIHITEWLVTNVVNSYLWNGSAMGIHNSILSIYNTNLARPLTVGLNGSNVGFVYKNTSWPYGLGYCRITCSNNFTQFVADSSTKGLFYMSNNGSDSSSCAQNITWTNSPTYVANPYTGLGNAINLVSASSQRGTFPRTTCNSVTNTVQDFTVDAWIKLTSYGSAYFTSVILSQKDGTGTGRTILAIDSDNGMLSSVYGSGGVRKQVGVVSLGVWHHVGMVFDYVSSASCYWYFYIDGKYVGSNSATSCPNEAPTGDFVVGAHKLEAQEFFNGVIDELHISLGQRPASYFSDRYKLCSSVTFNVQNNEEAPSPFITFSNGLYYVGYINYANQFVIYKSTNSTPSQSSDFVKISSSTPISFKKNRIYIDSISGANFLTFLFEHGPSLSDTISETPSVGSYQWPIPLGVNYKLFNPMINYLHRGFSQ